MEQNLNQGMIDTTDSLEAVSVMKGMKNFLFWVLLASLLISQAIFWMDRLGLIEKSDCTNCVFASGGVQSACLRACPMPADLPIQQPAQADPNSKKTHQPVLVPLTATTPIAERVEEVAKKVGLEVEPKPEPAPDEKPETITEPAPETGESAMKSFVDVLKDKELEFFKISCRSAFCFIRVCNFFMVIAAILYCLTLLMNLKISLTGKLGGINHITRAFFCSLFLLVFLTPWQVLLPGAALGAMYLPTELLCGTWAKAESSGFWKVLLYLRFTGFWLIALWLLVCAQSRSIKWARATLRRLGMAR